MPLYFIQPFGVSGDRTTIATTGSETTGPVSYQYGFNQPYSLPLSTNPAALPVPRVSFNQLMYDTTSNIQQYQQHGVPEFITTSDNGGTPFTYSKNAIVRYNNGTSIENYISLTNGNTSLPTVTANWTQVSSNSPFLNGTNAWTGANSFKDGTNFSLLNSSDQTKIIRFDGSLISTGNTRTFQVPNSSGVLAILSLQQTWTQIQTFPGIILTDSTVPANGIYLPAANTLGFAVNSAAEVQLTSTALAPAVTAGSALGTTALMWNGLFLAATTTINWNNGNATLTHSAGNLTSNVPLTANGFIPSSSSVPTNGMYLPGANTLGWATNSAASLQLTATSLAPAVSAGLNLGTTLLQWGSLFLQSGGVINFNNGNATITHSAALLTFNTPLALGSNGITMTGSLAATGARVTKGWFVDAEFTNAPSIGGTAASGSGGIARTNSPTFVTPTLGAALASSINFGASSLASYQEGTWTPVWTGLTVVGTPTYTGNYIKIGKLVYCTVGISSTTTTASTSGATTFTGLPFTAAFASVMGAVNTNSNASYGGGEVGNTSATPTWAATQAVTLSFLYISTT